MSDARVEISISGRIKSSASSIATVGAILSCNGDNAVIDDISMSAGAKEFTKLDIKATSYEGVSDIAPNLG